MPRLPVALALMLFVTGCGSRRPAAGVERGRAAVVAALDAWKSNSPQGGLKALPDPVEFVDELRATHALSDYTLGRVDAADPELIRFAVTLKLRDKKGKSTEREVVYAVALKSPVVVSRDPYF